MRLRVLLLQALLASGVCVKWSPSWIRYHKLLFLVRNGYWPQLSPPRSLNEKIVWMKLNLRDPRLPLLTDKLVVREYVKRTAPELRIPKVLFVADSEDQIPFGELPCKCVIKSNHGCGYVIFFDRSKADRDEIRRQCRRWLRGPYGTVRGEWAYQSIPRSLFGEELLLDEHGRIPADYKVYVFNGRAQYVLVVRDRFGTPTHDYYDMRWHRLSIESPGRVRGPDVPPPQCLQEMCRAAEQLADDLPFMRVDLYEIAGQVWFGEVTFYPESGLRPFEPREFDFEAGSMLDLSPWGA